jgi:hypothetical protein
MAPSTFPTIVVVGSIESYSSGTDMKRGEAGSGKRFSDEQNIAGNSLLAATNRLVWVLPKEKRR